MRAIARNLTVFSLAALRALVGSALFTSAAEAGPINNTQPSISPPTVFTTAPQQGQTLTEGPGTWSGTGTITTTIQWLRCDSLGSNCVAIPGATNPTYTLASADVGSTIEAQEPATDGTGPTQQNSAPPLVVIPLPPTLVTGQPPTISGTTQQGQTLTEANGSWTNNPTLYGYQWLRCDNSGSNCANIHNATNQTYTLTSADVNNTVAVEETASNAGGPGSPADSTPTAVIAPPPPVNMTRPTISGTAQVGQGLTENNGTWTNGSPPL